jgi:hypothetical protein
MKTPNASVLLESNDPTSLASAGGHLLSGEERAVFLSQIPSETTLAERTLLFDFFQNRWDGVGTVVEIGPFLGGTTRAIACGMLNNPRLSDEAVLHTFDRFGDYYSEEKLRQTIDPLVRGGSFSAAQADELCRGADFERIFSAIHRPHAYARLVHLHNSPLPDRPAEIDGSTSLDCLQRGGELGAVFVDGCKSWASTHYAMRFLLPRMRMGAPVIFQDFGWYTCFWISSAAHALRDFLEFETYADSTYVFRLNRPITAADVTARFGRTPDAMGENFFREASTALLQRSQRLGDLRGELIARLHCIAALVTINRKAKAAEMLKQLDVRRYAAHVGMIQGCIKSPTYRAGNKQIYWNEPAGKPCSGAPACASPSKTPVAPPIGAGIDVVTPAVTPPNFSAGSISTSSNLRRFSPQLQSARPRPRQRGDGAL